MEKEKLDPEIVKAIDNICKDPNDSRAKYAVNSYYWKRITDIVKEKAGGGKNQELDLSSYRMLIDFGLLDKKLLEDKESVLEDAAAVIDEKEDTGESGFYYLSTWLSSQYKILLNFNKKEDLEKKIRNQEHKIKKTSEQLRNLQNARVGLFKNAVKTHLLSIKQFSNARLDSFTKKLDTLKIREDFLMKSLIRKRKISSGVFMSLEEKRAHIKKEEELNDLTKQQTGIIADARNEIVEKNILKIGEKIEGFISDIVEGNERVEKIKKDLNTLSEETAKLTPAEVEKNLTEEIEYLRDLSKLSANRLRIEPVSVLFGKNKIIKKSDVDTYINRIVEFDPKLFMNSRVSIFGKPGVVIIPGKGNGLYDWKNNVLIIPTMPSTSLEISVINAVVEYKIDVDDEKRMMFSYNQIKEYSGIKSGWTLREKFTKDYITWMTYEYKGYKVLSKDVRAWFEREVGPNKTELVIPMEYSAFQMSKAKYEKLFEDLKEKYGEKGSNDIEVCFGLGTIYAQEEKWEDAIKCFTRCFELDKTFKVGHYNLALSCEKGFMKQDAIKHFNQFIKLNPSSWWSGVARDHLMKLR